MGGHDAAKYTTDLLTIYLLGIVYVTVLLVMTGFEYLVRKWRQSRSPKGTR